MARKRFTQEQIVAILREAERGTNRPTLFRKHGICEQTFYRWKRMYGGLGVSEVRRIKELEELEKKAFCQRQSNVSSRSFRQESILLYTYCMKEME